MERTTRSGCTHGDGDQTMENATGMTKALTGSEKYRYLMRCAHCETELLKSPYTGDLICACGKSGLPWYVEYHFKFDPPTIGEGLFPPPWENTRENKERTEAFILGQKVQIENFKGE